MSEPRDEKSLSPGDGLGDGEAAASGAVAGEAADAGGERSRPQGPANVGAAAGSDAYVKPEPAKPERVAGPASRVGGSTASEAPSLCVVRYSEIGLKGENRSWFEERLRKNMKDQLAGLDVVRVERVRGRILVHHAADPRDVGPRLARVFGIRSFSPARRVPAPTVESVVEVAAAEALEAIARAVPAPVTFRVESERADKTFPLRSMDLSARIGAEVLRRAPALKVRLKDPDLTIGVEIQPGAAFVYAERHDGPGGLPVGTSGKVVLLLSGGIDSPVAGLLLQKRGCQVAPLYFHAFPYTGDAAKEKVIDLARVLAERQTVLDLRIAPFADVQTMLRDRCRGELLVVLYRRMMMRIATRIAAAIGAPALGTGESVGQVASQTLPNLLAIEDATRLPVLRPLAGHDKEETVLLARRFGTYETSIRPADDCCSLFVPKHPATRARLDAVLAEEEKVPVEELAAAAAGRVETLRFLRGTLTSSARTPPK
jgi:thiamine biosynthesis protein ThiI